MGLLDEPALSWLQASLVCPRVILEKGHGRAGEELCMPAQVGSGLQDMSHCWGPGDSNVDVSVQNGHFLNHFPGAKCQRFLSCDSASSGWG